MCVCQDEICLFRHLVRAGARVWLAQTSYVSTKQICVCEIHLNPDEMLLLPNSIVFICTVQCIKQDLIFLNGDNFQ